ncbi:phosphatase PAP2 family protein [Desertifilum sp. FACHB-1129]|uniref:Phosphatidic acid phosphatase n=2 Tax=Desertifilum tharense IPPAS B-1220 TaxID=1781255 RepID=A0A1E5QDF9_9CYAN|nr:MULTISPECIES: phosphatase PAP2 family protein [Desertifilum]MDA0213110.1 phosphatase PAP2 family protein [Cyanobacteria bacterium FC1]MBD2314492.1 phosphatase PAP2 family protein [Desertifilum sp. FACHB-1129]MBD2321107.1 phosphatase PAP2 family protein [Desertifilum sp. FACHB-866]MBD2331584.1 phosphatase PAP2 family protein [Desertifilum sp. FACHB-868]OEJ72689.1 phosphatidic acid phosphatase [Desertifilum tharense IPPAS B-1220]
MRTQLFSLISTIRVVGLAIAAFAMWLFATLAEDVLDKETHALDTAILLALQRIHTPLLDQVMEGITFLGEPDVLLVVSLLLGGILLWRNHRSQATILAIAGVGAVGLNYWLKILFARDRPALWDRVIDVRFYSFPSGHAMISFAIYGAIAYLAITHYPRWRWLIITFTSLLILAIGFSRLYFGVHWPTDIVAGYTAGLIWLIACIFSREVWRTYRGLEQSPTEQMKSS